MPIYLDTETTGLSPSRGDSIVELAIVDEAGRTLIDTLVNPRRRIPAAAQRVHGISDEMVRGYPCLEDLIPQIIRLIRGQDVVIYNARFDVPFFPGELSQAKSVNCAMLRYSEAIGVARWQKLDVAAKHVGHQWTGVAHRALADALACKSVWEWVQRPYGKSDRPKTESKVNTGILVCHFCQQKLRVPSGRRLRITCPKCKASFFATA